MTKAGETWIGDRYGRIAHQSVGASAAADRALCARSFDFVQTRVGKHNHLAVNFAVKFAVTDSSRLGGHGMPCPY